MRLGVIVCPHCNYVKGIDLSVKTTKCGRCGKTLELRKLKIFYETDSQEKLRQAIGMINAEVEGKANEFKKILQAKH
jgi:transcription elongation factor Elf1